MDPISRARSFARPLAAGVVLAAVVGGGCIAPAQAPAAELYVAAPPGPPVEYEPFAGPLSAYGHWFVYGDYGWVWTPAVVPADWRPYTVGRWVWSDAGWMWISEEPWGWATYHYGRWFYDGAYGWVWVPDTVWGPAWVCWRTGPAFYGWAPLPPGYVFGVSTGHCDPWMGGWAFVNADWFLSPHLWTYVVPPSRNVYVYERTEPDVRTSTSRSPTNGGRTRDILVQRGPDPGEVSARTGRPVLRHSVETLRADPGRAASDALDGDRVRITRPEFPRELAPTRVEPAPGARRLEEPPDRGQHRPEVPRPAPPPRELAPDDRGPRPPAPEPRIEPPPRTAPEPRFEPPPRTAPEPRERPDPPRLSPPDRGGGRDRDRGDD